LSFKRHGIRLLHLNIVQARRRSLWLDLNWSSIKEPGTEWVVNILLEEWRLAVMGHLEHLFFLLPTEISKTVVHLVMKFVIGLHDIGWCHWILLIAGTKGKVTVYRSLRSSGHWRHVMGLEFWSDGLLLEHLLLLLLSEQILVLLLDLEVLNL
jgi:hypothetical protein